MLVDQIDRLYFGFIGMSIVGLTADLDGVVSIVISRAILTKRKIAISFFRLFLQQVVMSFKGTGLLIQAPRYFFAQYSFFTKLNSRAIVIALLLTPWYRPRYHKCHQHHTSHCYQLKTRKLAMYYSPFFFFSYLVTIVIYKKRCKSLFSRQFKFVNLFAYWM